MTRHDRIRMSLRDLEESGGAVQSFYAYNPDGRVRWVVETRLGTRVFSTSEAEVFMHGVGVGYDAAYAEIGDG